MIFIAVSLHILYIYVLRMRRNELGNIFNSSDFIFHLKIIQNFILFQKILFWVLIDFNEYLYFLKPSLNIYIFCKKMCGIWFSFLCLNFINFQWQYITTNINFKRMFFFFFSFVAHPVLLHQIWIHYVQHLQKL